VVIDVVIDVVIYYLELVGKIKSPDCDVRAGFVQFFFRTN
jgi:hypothetical protein